MLGEALQEMLSAAVREYGGEAEAVPVRRGEEIWESPDYPRTFEEFIGQAGTVEHLRACIASAQARSARLDHVLIASGTSGAGKTSLMKLIAASMGVGIVEVSGQVSAEEAQAAVAGMEDGDILAFDEVHLAVAGGKHRAEWLLHLLQDGGFMGPRGFVKAPDITVVAATTDAGRLPETILNRFTVRPVLKDLTLADATLICQQLAAKNGITVEGEVAERIATATLGSTRDMKALLVAYRDTEYAVGRRDFDLACTWVGVTPDGLTTQMQDYLLTLFARFKGLASVNSISSVMGEPGPMRHTEKGLLMLGLIDITPKGRTLTDQGWKRAHRLAVERLEG